LETGELFHEGSHCLAPFFAAAAAFLAAALEALAAAFAAFASSLFVGALVVATICFLRELLMVLFGYGWFGCDCHRLRLELLQDVICYDTLTVIQGGSGCTEARRHFREARHAHRCFEPLDDILLALAPVGCILTEYSVEMLCYLVCFDLSLRGLTWFVWLGWFR
jgi:hypothetical protein